MPISLAKEVVEKYDDATSYRSTIDFDTNTERWKNLFEGTSDEMKARKEKGKSAVLPPWAGALVDRFTATFYISLFSQEPYFGIFPTSDDLDSILSARIAQDIVDWQLHRPSPRYQMSKFIQYIGAMGFGCLRTGWDFAEDDFSLTNWNIKYFYFPSYSEDLTKLDWCIFECWRFYKDLVAEDKAFKERYGTNLYQNLDKAQKLEGSYLEDVSEKYSTLSRKKPIHILEFYDKDRKIVVAGKSVTIQRTKNPISPSLPVILGSDVPKLEGIYGTGEIEAHEPYIRQISTITNQRNDDVVQSLIPAWIQNAGVEILNEEAISDLRPGVRIQVRVPYNVPLDSVLKPFPAPNVTQQSYMETAASKDDLQERRGFHEYYRGKAPEQRETASGIKSLQAAGGTIPRYTMMLAMQTAFVQIPAHAIAWSRKYLSKRTILRLVATAEAGIAKFRTVSRDDIQKDYYFTEKVSAIDPSAIPEVERNQLMQALQILLPLKEALPNVNFEKLVKMFLQTFPNKELASVVGTPKEVPGIGGPRTQTPRPKTSTDKTGLVEGGILGKALGGR